MMRWLMIGLVVLGVLAVVVVLGRQVRTASDMVLNEVHDLSEGAKRRAQEVDRLSGASPAQSATDRHDESMPVLLPAPPQIQPSSAQPRAIRRGPPLRVGATAIQVQAVMGDPEVRTWDERGGETWWYGHSSIVMRNHAVASWHEEETPLGAAR